MADSRLESYTLKNLANCCESHSFFPNFSDQTPQTFGGFFLAKTLMAPAIKTR